jgi:integrase
MGCRETKAARRRIKLDARSIVALTARRKAARKQEAAASPWIFSDATGGFLERFAVIRAFVQAVKAAKLPPIRFLDLRHTHATLMLLAGVNAKAVSERLGHSSIAITLDIYAHVLPGTCAGSPTCNSTHSKLRRSSPTTRNASRTCFF